MPQLSSTILDATRISDGAYVSLKSLSKSVHPYEALNVLDIENRIILVMPLLCRYNNPAFQTIGKAINFFMQIFEVGSYLMQVYYILIVTRVSRLCINIM